MSQPDRGIRPSPEDLRRLTYPEGRYLERTVPGPTRSVSTRLASTSGWN